MYKEYDDREVEVWVKKYIAERLGLWFSIVSGINYIFNWNGRYLMDYEDEYMYLYF